MLKFKKLTDAVFVTFYLEKEANEAYLLSSYFDWKPLKMRKKKDGNFYIRRKFPLPLKMEFGYKADGEWIIEKDLPKVPTPFNSFNSLLEMKG